MVRGVVPREDFLRGVPLQFPTQLDGDITQVADRRHAMANLHGEVRIAAALDAVQKVPMFARRIRVEVDFIGSDDGFQDFVRAGLQAAAPTAITDPAVRADELDARIARLAGHHDAVGVPVRNVVVLDRVIKSAFPIGAGALDFRRPAQFGVIAPLGRVEQVRAPVTDNAAGIVPDPTEIEVNAIRVVGRVGAGPSHIS